MKITAVRPPIQKIVIELTPREATMLAAMIGNTNTQDRLVLMKHDTAYLVDKMKFIPNKHDSLNIGNMYNRIYALLVNDL